MDILDSILDGIHLVHIIFALGFLFTVSLLIILWFNRRYQNSSVLQTTPKRKVSIDSYHEKKSIDYPSVTTKKRKNKSTAESSLPQCPAKSDQSTNETESEHVHVKRRTETTHSPKTVKKVAGIQPKADKPSAQKVESTPPSPVVSPPPRPTAPTAPASGKSPSKPLATKKGQRSDCTTAQTAPLAKVNRSTVPRPVESIQPVSILATDCPVDGPTQPGRTRPNPVMAARLEQAEDDWKEIKSKKQRSNGNRRQAVPDKTGREKEPPPVVIEPNMKTMTHAKPTSKTEDSIPPITQEASDKVIRPKRKKCTSKSGAFDTPAVPTSSSNEDSSPSDCVIHITEPLAPISIPPTESTDDSTFEIIDLASLEQIHEESLLSASTTNTPTGSSCVSLTDYPEEPAAGASKLPPPTSPDEFPALDPSPGMYSHVVAQGRVENLLKDAMSDAPVAETSLPDNRPSRRRKSRRAD